jgi:type I restriction enzyme, S subunit
MSASAIVPEGYKQTEIGVFPKDWSVKQLGSLLSASPKYGINAPAVAFDLNLPTYIRITDISPDGYFIHDNKKSVIYPFSNLYQLSEGNIVFARTGASVGKSYMYNPKDGELVFAGFLIKVEPNIRLLYPNYLKFIVQTQTYWSWILENSMRSGQPGINGKQYATLPIPLPPTIIEQEYIGDTINDCEILIESLQELVAKKRDLKQGAMQELLTGKTRLPGFNGDWETKSIGDLLFLLADYTANGSFSSLKENVTYYNQFNFAALVRTTDLDKKKFNPKRFTDKRGYNFLSKTELFGGEIIVANVGSIGKVFKVPNYGIPMTLAPNTYLLKFHQDIDSEFMYQYMKTDEFVSKLMSKVGSTTLLAINKNNLREIDISLPDDLREQEAIAEVLSDMDAEIITLEKRLEKAKAIKQGMMQQLLTGKIRLVEPQTSQEVSA